MALTATAAHIVLAGLGGSLRIEFHAREHWLSAIASGKPILLAVWHGRMLIPILAHRQQGVLGLVSQSRDGDLATAVLHRMGYRSVRGSSSRGGREAFHELRAALTPGTVAAIIPDGPRGPARTLKPGLVRLAALTGALIVPLSAAARPAYRMASWDRFLLPAPLARAVVVYGCPIAVPPGPVAADQEEQIGAQVTAGLDSLEALADQLVAGRT